ncbi:phage tail protein [Dechloromonas denitrificans]|uniref:phage tail protein n=1 Tax=Dechloromonas denitrificans TaxID=281362 RepID=UPI001CF804AB|nr:phage tail protein [Dechloromonas denitrificans]UCV02300.1 phage tail protein [Dechloromonas denitrificans]
MKKPAELRAHLTTWVPDLARNPDKLHVFVEKGRIFSRYGESLAFEYHYQLTLGITDYAESIDAVIVPLLGWIQANQPNLLLDEKLRENLIAFDAELCNAETVDLQLILELSERVLVTEAPGGYECRHIGEPPLPGLGGPTGWTLYHGADPLTP